MTRAGRGFARWRRRSERGQSLVEFAVGVVVLVIIVSGVLDLGRAYFALVAIENGAGEGAIFASYHPAWMTSGDAEAQCPVEVALSEDPNACSIYAEYNNIEYRATHESPTGLVDLTNITVDREPDSGWSTGQHITVTVTYSYTVLTPLLHVIVPDGVMPMTAQASQVIVNVD